MSWTYIAGASGPTGNENTLRLDAGTTENDLSGLEGKTGVTVSIDKNHIKVYRVDEHTRIEIKGTLYHDPDAEILILEHDNIHADPDAGTWGKKNALKIANTGASPAFYYYGTERTDATTGRVTKSKGAGLIFTGNPQSNWHPSDAAIAGGGDRDSRFVCRGGVILTTRMISFGGKFDVDGLTIRGISNNLEYRTPFGSSSSTFKGTIDGITIPTAPDGFDPVFTFHNGSVAEVLGTWQEKVLRNFDVSENIANVDVGQDGSVTYGHTDWIVINSATGSDVRKMWRATRGNTGQYGTLSTRKEVSFTIKDISGNPIEGVAMYLKDTPSAYAKNGKFIHLPNDTLGTYENYKVAFEQLGKSPSLTRGVANDDGDLVYDYTYPEEYSKITDASGQISTFEVLTSIQIHDRTTSDSTASQYYVTFGGGKWKEADGQQPQYTDWDTDRFGNFYKVDRRSDSNSNLDDFTFKFCSYGHSLSSSSQQLKGLGELEVNWVLFDDLVITESDKAIVDAYTEIDTSAKFYDRAKSFLTANYEGEGSTIVSRAGIDIETTFDIEIDASATSAFAFDGSKITIKASAFSGNITTTGLVTTLNDAVVLGTITDSSGTRATLQYNISGLIQHSRVQLFNVTADTEIFNGAVNSTSYSAQYTEGVEVSTGDEIRMRVTRQFGTTAYLPFEATAIATASGFSFKASQLLDLVYNTNGIDGSAITTLTADFPNVQVDVDDADGVCDVREIYARYVNIITTEEGIRQWFGGITALNAVNYQVNTQIADLTIQNIGTNGVNLGVARIFRDDGAIILAQGTAPITQDNGEFVQFIAPQVEASLGSVTKNTNLIPALL